MSLFGQETDPSVADIVANRVIDAVLQQGAAARELRVQIRNQFELQIDEAMVGKMQKEAIAASTEVMCDRLFGCSTLVLYETLNTKKGDRDNLPAAIQNAIFLAEGHAVVTLSESTFGGDSFERMDKVVRISGESAGKVRRFLPW